MPGARSAIHASQGGDMIPLRNRESSSRCCL
jgi:hypothetical protein